MSTEEKKQKQISKIERSIKKLKLNMEMFQGWYADQPEKLAKIEKEIENLIKIDEKKLKSLL
jgi:hypothetical protein